MKYLLITLLSFSAIAQDVEIDFNQLFNNKTYADENLAIGYMDITPVYEDNPDPKRLMKIEAFVGSLDDPKTYKGQLNWIKDFIISEKAVDPNFKLNVRFISPSGHIINDTSQADDVIEIVKAHTRDIEFEQAPPESLATRIYELDKKGRFPNSIKKPRLSQRWLWTLIRGASGAGASITSLVISSGFTPGLAIAAGIYPGILSGLITYHNGAYGSWLGNGSWSRFLLESDRKWIKGFRKFTGLQSVIDKMQSVENKANRNPNVRLSKRETSLLKRFRLIKKSDSSLKWWATEVAFVGASIQIPQAIGNIANSTRNFGEFLTGMKSITGMSSLLHGAWDLLADSTIGFIAQGPGDIAIQKRKYQKFEKLKLDVQSGKIKVQGKAKLLSELDVILNKGGSVTDISHKLLQKIENNARFKATIVSLFSVGGVALKISGSPLATAVLISVGAGGSAYYAYVADLFKIKSKVNMLVQRYIEPLKANVFYVGDKVIQKFDSNGKFTYKVATRMRNFLHRYCMDPWLMGRKL
jgi:hypothetical protein